MISIKITLYRLAKHSHLAEALIAAAEAGKEVTAVFELRARFDEANNIEWSQRFEEAGCGYEAKRAKMPAITPNCRRQPKAGSRNEANRADFLEKVTILCGFSSETGRRARHPGRRGPEMV